MRRIEKRNRAYLWQNLSYAAVYSKLSWPIGIVKTDKHNACFYMHACMYVLKSTKLEFIHSYKPIIGTFFQLSSKGGQLAIKHSLGLLNVSVQTDNRTYIWFYQLNW